MKRRSPKIVAFYLPQYHTIPENDEWWGKGFTDWIAAKQAKPLFPGHYQPRIPDHDNYYNLLDKKVMQRQACLARKAGIYGFCMYHYWFGDKMLLEKPAENLLRWNDINIHYCFSWANQSWISSWSKLTGGNAWYHTKNVSLDNQNGMLVEQKYGEEEEWKKHFEYLLPFFKDSRYIKKDNKPVFVIYMPSAIPRLRAMIKCWKALAESNGLGGIYFIGTNCTDWKEKGLDASLLYEPSYTCLYEAQKVHSALGRVIDKIRKKALSCDVCFPNFLNYDRIWRQIINRSIKKNIYPGAFVDFDSSPRKGKKATIFYGVIPQKFKKYLTQLYQECQKKNCEYIFITAWNEWGEGAYLEPDQRYGMRYLACIRRIVKGI